ncbi:MAG: VCBS repeat-containing protein [Candidatus Krumholzibacteriota bacterium]|nr:VCBS repeat-containing protein [Candidatus Krumholzibacteriota bacterium]
MSRTRRPKRLFPLLLASLFLATALPAGAAVHEVALPLDEARDPQTAVGRWLADVLADPGADRALAPTLTWWWALAPGERIVAASLVDVDEAPVAELSRAPRRLPLRGSEGSAVRGAGEGPLWFADYPLQLSPPRHLHGRSFQALALTPLRAEAGRLLVLRGARLRLVTDFDGPATARTPLRPDFPLHERILASLGAGLLNPGSLPPAVPRAAGGGDFPTEVPSIEGSAVEMVIVTVDSFADLCAGYADLKTSYGLPTVVRTLEWIEQRYPFGSDRAELVRNFVVDAYEKWSLRFLLIVADVEQIPSRMVYTDIFFDPRESPSDLYFGCLDGDWNANHNAFWAEDADTAIGDWGDETDLLPEVIVGRLPAGTRDEVAAILTKSETYMQGTAAPYQNRVLLLGEVLFPLDYPTNPNITIDGAEYCESLYVKYMGPDQDVTRLYENTADYPGCEPLSVQAALDSMGAGQNIVVHHGHGMRQTMSVANGSITSNMINALPNGDRTFLLYMVNCTAAAFDFNCLAESFLFHDSGGAFAVIGSTRETFPTVSSLYQDVFFDLFTSNPDLRLGEIYTGMLNNFEPETLEGGGYRWAHTSHTLLADPSNWLHWTLLDSLAIETPPTHVAGSGPLVVTITDRVSLLPRPGAQVTLRRGDEDYLRGVTDTAGQVEFAPNPETGGRYQIRVTARDATPVNGTVDVLAPSGEPLLSAALVAVDDVADGTVAGNGNGVPERGEIVRLTITLQNNGTFWASNTGAVLRCADPAVTVLDSTDTYGTILAGNTSDGGDPYLVQLGDVADDAILPFTLSITCTEVTTEDDFYLEAAAPLLALYRTELDDTAQGDGDGDLEEGEAAAVGISLANYGRATAPDVTATIEPTAGSSLTVTQGVAVLGDLDSLSLGLGPALFEVSRGGPEPPELLLVLADGLGHSDSLTMLLARPAAPATELSSEYGSDASRVIIDWTPPGSEDAYAYIVLRAAEAGGPYAEISTHWMRSCTYEDEGLDTFTQYWYRVQTLSAAGLTGVLSDSLKVTTNVPQLLGWPQRLYEWTAGTPVVADFTGDGRNELLVGADVIYAFHPDGTELADGDGDPYTHGPLITDGHNYINCSLTAANVIPGRAGVELIGGSWDTAEIYVWEINGTGISIEATVAPGWPRSIAHSYGIYGTPSVADVDGDSDMEIFASDVGGHLLAWHHDGTELIDGDNNPLTQGVFATGLGGWLRSTCAFGDVDGDRANEIFICSMTGYLYAWHADGTLVDGFPFDTGMEMYCSPAIGDVDGDGLPEIVFPAENDSLYVLDHDGSRHPGWPVYWFNNNWGLAPSPALADLTGDGYPEIFVCGVHNNEHMDVAWFDADGTLLPGWPRTTSHYTVASPSVADVDGDGDFEVFVANEDALIEAWHHDGTPVDGFPLGADDFLRTTPTFVDFDGNGQLDMIVAGWDLYVRIWEFPVLYDPAATPWYTFQHDATRSGNYDAIDWVVDVAEEDLPPGVVRLDRNWPNPFNPKTHIRFTLTGEGQRPVRLSIHDVRGRLVAKLVDEALPAGTYVQSWQGRDDSARAVASGIYFARLQVDSQVETRKLTLLK